MKALFLDRTVLLNFDTSMTNRTSSFAPGGARLILLITLLVAGSFGAVQAQWAWRDANGEVNYSDSPPPSDVSRSNILREPTSVSASPDTNPTPAAPSAPSAGPNPTQVTPRVGATAAPPPSPAPQASKPIPAPKTLAEQDADFRKRLAEQQKAEEKQTQDEAQASQRADACNQAKSYLDMLQSGTRLLRPDANGQRNFLDDDQRSAEIQKAQDAIEKNC